MDTDLHAEVTKWLLRGGGRRLQGQAQALAAAHRDVDRRSVRRFPPRQHPRQDPYVRPQSSWRCSGVADCGVWFDWTRQGLMCSCSQTRFDDALPATGHTFLIAQAAATRYGSRYDHAKFQTFLTHVIDLDRFPCNHPISPTPSCSTFVYGKVPHLLSQSLPKPGVSSLCVVCAHLSTQG